MRTRGVIKIGLLGLVFALAGCRTHDNISVSVPTDPSGWGTGSMRVVRFQNHDTLTPRNLTLFVVHDSRTTDDTHTVDIEVEMHTPHGAKFSEDVTVSVDHPDEKNTIRQSCRTYRTDAILNDTGEYRIVLKNKTLHQLRGVRAVGIEITDSENGKR